MSKGREGERESQREGGTCKREFYHCFPSCREIKQCFEELGEDSDCRVVLLTGAGKNFSAGLDVIDFADVLSQSTAGEDDGARKAMSLVRIIKSMQGSFTAIEKVYRFAFLSS